MTDLTEWWLSLACGIYHHITSLVSFLCLAFQLISYILKALVCVCVCVEGLSDAKSETKDVVFGFPSHHGTSQLSHIHVLGEVRKLRRDWEISLCPR